MFVKPYPIHLALVGAVPTSPALSALVGLSSEPSGPSTQLMISGPPQRSRYAFVVDEMGRTRLTWSLFLCCIGRRRCGTGVFSVLTGRQWLRSAPALPLQHELDSRLPSQALLTSDPHAEALHSRIHSLIVSYLLTSL